MLHPRVSAGPGHVLALWGLSFGFPGREGRGPQSIRWALNKVPELQEMRPFPYLQGPRGHTARSSQSQGPSNPLEETLSWLENPEAKQKHGGWRVLWGRTERMERGHQLGSLPTWLQRDDQAVVVQGHPH